MWIKSICWQILLGAQGKSPPGFELTTFKLEGRRCDHCATGPLPLENFAFLFSLCAGCKGLRLGLGCGCEKTIYFRDLQNCSFGTAPVNLRRNASGSEKLFFRAPLKEEME